MAILDSVKKLASKLGAETSGRDITEQINLINKKLDEASSSGRDIAEAVSVFADKEDGTATFTTKTITENGTYDASDDGVSGYSSVTVDVSGGGSGFNKMIVNYPPDNGQGTAFINNENGSVDVSAISTSGIYILNPVKELKVEGLVNIGNGYDIYFVPTQNCKIYEGDTEINPNEIFVPVQTPGGPTTYDPDGTTVFRITGEKTPYATTRELKDCDTQVEITIE